MNDKAAATWADFDAAYREACDSGKPQDWMQAALVAQQIRYTASQPTITESMVEAAAQRMVGLVMGRVIERPQLVQWQQWAGSARAILEAALETK